MESSNAVRHVVIALSLSAFLFVIAGDAWNRNIKNVKPVRVVKKGER